MALLTSPSFSSPLAPPKPSPPSLSIHNPISALHSSPSTSSLHLGSHCRLSTRFVRNSPPALAQQTTITAAVKPEALKIMICGAPASGKGTQCELIRKKYGLVHISAGDLLRAEIAAGTENGKRAKEYMEKGMLVPNEIVVMMVKERLLQPDAQETGWLLDGYPRSFSQAKALEDLHIRPDLFILLDVSEDALVDRVVGRRLDPVTGKIYHLKYSPPESDEIASRLTQRFDDTEEKVKLRLQTHHQNAEDVLTVYKGLICKIIINGVDHCSSGRNGHDECKIDGNAPKEDVFAEIDSAMSYILKQKSRTDSTSLAAGIAR